MGDKHLKLNSNYLMPTIGYGTYLVKNEEALRQAINCGYRLIDTAYLYQNEDLIGKVVNEFIDAGKLKREDFFIVSKLPHIGNRPEDVDKYLKASLKNLNMDYIDLYLIHQPFCTIPSHMDDLFPKDEQGKTVLGPKTDMENLWKTMEQKVDEGLVKSIGISNFNTEQVHRIMKCARIAPAVNEVEAYLYLQQGPLNEVCKQYGIKIISFGNLGAPYREGGSQGVKHVLKDPQVNKIAQTKNRTAAQVAMRFLIQLGYTVIPKSEKAERIRANFQLFDFHLTEDEMTELKKLDMGPEGRVLTYKVMWPGTENHPDYPFNIPH